MPVKTIRTLGGKHRNKRANTLLGVILAFVAGAINAAGFLAVGTYTSHMTGITSSIGDYIALNRMDAALISAGYVLSFIAGAVISAIMINWARTRNLHSEYAGALMLEATLLLTFGLFAAKILDLGLPLVHTTICLLCFIMGLQNAIITKISNAEIRTTHVTGLATDIGIAIGRFFYSKVSKDPFVVIDGEKLKLRSCLFFSFLIGAVLGAVSFKAVGFIMTIPFALILALLAFFPIWDDLRKNGAQ